MEIKYEAVFGPQELFDGAPREVTHATQGGGFYRINNAMEIEYVSYGALDGCVRKSMDGYLIAERRIIRTPTWSITDQNAGRLPDVGAKCRHRSATDERRIVAVTDDFIGIEVLENEIMPYFITHYEFMQHYKPIETPEEKAARLREEWVDSAITETEKRKDTTADERERLKARLKDIYQALLLGDLPVPVAPEQNK